MKKRFGIFFLVIGLLLLGLFILTDMGGQPHFPYFLAAGLAMIGGIILLWRSPSTAPAAPNGRFRTIKKLGSRQAKPKSKSKDNRKPDTKSK